MTREAVLHLCASEPICVCFVAFPCELRREGDEGCTELRALDENDEGGAEQQASIGR